MKRAILLIIVILMLVACEKKQVPSTNQVVKINNGQISLEEFKNYLKQRPFPPGKKIDEKLIKGRLDEMVLAEVLYQEAINQKLDRDPAIRRKIQQILTHRLLTENVEKPLLKQDISDEEIKSYFEENEYSFNRPPEIKIADIFIKAGNNSEKKNLRQKAETAFKEAKKIEGKWSGFGPLIKKHSDKHPNYPKGAPGYFNNRGKPANIEIEVAKAAFTLKIGKVSDRVIETKEGFHIFMVTGKRPGMTTDWKQQKHRIKHKIRNEKLETARKEFIDNLKNKAKVTVNEEVLEELTADFNRKRKPSSVNSKPPALPTN